MTITTGLTRAAGLAAIAEYAVRETAKIVTAVLSLIGITGNLPAPGQAERRARPGR